MNLTYQRNQNISGLSNTLLILNSKYSAVTANEKKLTLLETRTD